MYLATLAWLAMLVQNHEEGSNSFDRLEMGQCNLLQALFGLKKGWKKDGEEKKEIGVSLINFPSRLSSILMKNL